MQDAEPISRFGFDPKSSSLKYYFVIFDRVANRCPEAEVGPPYHGEDGFTEQQVVEKYRRYLANWAVYGLSRV